MKPEGLKVYEDGVKRPQMIYDIKAEANLIVPDDLLNALKNNPEAYSNFINFPPSSRKLYIFWLNDAKRAETRSGRIAKIVDRSEKNIRADVR